jgi:hypothetical protein
MSKKIFVHKIDTSNLKHQALHVYLQKEIPNILKVSKYQLLNSASLS